MNSFQWMILVVMAVLIQGGALLFLASVGNRINDESDYQESLPEYNEDPLTDIMRESRRVELDALGIDDELKDILF